MKSVKKAISLFLCLVITLSICLCAVSVYAYEDDITLVPPEISEENTEPALDLMDRINNIDLGIDGYGITSRFGEILDRIQQVLLLILQYVSQTFSGSLNFGVFGAA